MDVILLIIAVIAAFCGIGSSLEGHGQGSVFSLGMFIVSAGAFAGSGAVAGALIIRSGLRSNDQKEDKKQ